MLGTHEKLVDGGHSFGGKVVENEVVVGRRVDVDGLCPVGHAAKVDMRSEAPCELSLSGTGVAVEDETFRSGLTRVLDLRLD